MAQEIRDEPDRLPLHLRDWWLLALCGLFMAGDLVFWHWSLRMTSVANATLLGNSAPVFVTLAGWLLFGQRFSRLYLAGLLLAFGAVALLVNPVAAALFAWMMLGEGVGPLQAVGGAGVLVGIALARQGSVVRALSGGAAPPSLTKVQPI